MENYIVRTLVEFDDYQGLEIKPENPKVRRKINENFNCTKERYEHLKNLGLVLLVGIEKVDLTEEVKPAKKVTKKRK